MLDLWIDIGEYMDAILLAAGTSQRMGAGVDKQLTRLAAVSYTHLTLPTSAGV